MYKVFDSWLSYNQFIAGFLHSTMCRVSEVISLSNGNLLSFLLRCGTRQYERGTQWDISLSNNLIDSSSNDLKF